MRTTNVLVIKILRTDKGNAIESDLNRAFVLNQRKKISY